MINLWDLNAKALISFFLMMITGLLIYIAFYKDSGAPTKRKAKG